MTPCCVPFKTRFTTYNFVNNVVDWRRASEAVAHLSTIRRDRDSLRVLMHDAVLIALCSDQVCPVLAGRSWRTNDCWYIQWTSGGGACQHSAWQHRLVTTDVQTVENIRKSTSFSRQSIRHWSIRHWFYYVARHGTTGVYMLLQWTWPPMFEMLALPPPPAPLLYSEGHSNWCKWIRGYSALRDWLMLLL